MSTTDESTEENSPAASTGYQLNINLTSPIKLQLGSRQVVVKPDTLAEANFFKPIISGRWRSNQQADGSYFIDADPDIFKHILKYLRRGIYPIFWDPERGHNDVLYFELLQEARYFQVDKLVEWLERKRYLQAVCYTIDISEISESNPTLNCFTGFGQVEYHHVWTHKRVYVCPRNIACHMTENDCGRQCGNVRTNEGTRMYDEVPILKTLAVKKRVSITGHTSWEEEDN